MNILNARRSVGWTGRCGTGMLFIWLGTVLPLMAADIYVSTHATPETPYNTWANAFTNVQDALDYALDDDTIHLAGHIFAGVPAGGNDYVFLLESRTNLTLKGGYEASLTLPPGEHPGPRDLEHDQWPTILARSDGNARVLHLVALSNVVIDGVTVRDGWPRGTTLIDGGGIHMAGCRDMVFDNVRVLENNINGGNDSRGAGLSLVNSDLVMTHGLIAGNQLRHESGVLGSGSRGGGLSLVDSQLIMTDSVIASNLVHPNRASWAGGVYLGGSSVMTVSNATIVANHCSAEGNAQGRGGAFYVDNGAELRIHASRLTGNIAERGQTRAAAYGGAVYVNTGGTVDIAESVLADNQSVSNYESYGGAVYNLGTLRLRNTLIAGNEVARTFRQNGSGIETAGANSLTMITHCTIVDNEPGIGVGIRYGGGTIAVSNSIVWGHAEEFDLVNFPRDADGRLPDVWYSNVGDILHAGWQGSHAADPVFADSTWYHLASTAGHYTGGYFGDGDWTNATVNSPLIDRGDPAADVSREPMPNGGRINMGAYANTKVAAKTPAAGEVPPTVSVSSALAWGRSSAVVRGAVTSPGDEIPLAYFDIWPDGGGVTNVIPLGLQTNAFERWVVGLDPETTYHFRVRAENSAGTVVSAVEIFLTRSMAPAAWYVTPAGDNTSGATWGAAHTCLNTTLGMLESGDTVYLAGDLAGEPPERDSTAIFSLANVDNIALLGGYQGATGLPPGEHPGPRDPALWPTVLRQAGGEARILYIASVSNLLVESVIIRDGDLIVPGNASGGGIYLSACRDAVFHDCLITENTARGHPSYGGGIALIDSELLLTDCVVSTNLLMHSRGAAGQTWGGAVYIDGASRLTVTNTVFDANHANAYGVGRGRGGALFVDSGGHLDLRDGWITGNIADRGQANTDGYGGGLYVGSGAIADLINVWILENVAESHGSGQGYGGGVYNQGTIRLRNTLIAGNVSNSLRSDGLESNHANARLVIESSTIVDNHAAAGNVGILHGAGVIALTNTIVWGHDDDLLDFPLDGEGHLLNVAHSLFDGFPAMNGVNGCLAGVDPEFVGHGDYRLRDGSSAHDNISSPAIDEGLNLSWMYSATDLDGNPRIRRSRRQLGAIVDMGAFEAEPPRGTLIMLR